MAYTAEISRRNPTAFLFLIDQSGSMSDIMPNIGISKAQFVADVLNRTLANLIIRCTKGSGVSNYFEIAVLGYGGNGVVNGFQGELAKEYLQPIANLEQSPLRVEDRIKKEPDGAGGIIEVNTKFPIWFEARASGGTPMCETMCKAAEILAPWCEAHPKSYPPTILHITDGESTDGNPEELVKDLSLLHTEDGNVLIFNLHCSELNNKPIEFPDSEDDLPNEYAKMLFRISSNFPTDKISIIKDMRRNCDYNENNVFYMFNADAVNIIEFFDIGTRASNLR